MDFLQTISLLIFTFTISLVSSALPQFGYPSPLDSQYEVYYQWNQIDYNFPNNSIRDQLINNGGFIQINCVPHSSLKVFQNQIFLTTPRYFPGVPYTLSTIPYRKDFGQNQGPKLTPFPSAEMNEIGNCSAFQLVQAIEIDQYNRLWIIDVGRVEILSATVKNLCPAKLVVVDLTNGNKIERIYEFPDSVVPRDSNVIKDTQIACTSRNDCFAYIANINVTQTSGLVIYDYKNNDAWAAVHPSMFPDPAKQNITIEGVTAVIPFGITGVGLTPRFTRFSTLYFSKLAGDHLYRIKTDILKNKDKLKQNPTLQSSDVEDLGVKPTGQADGMIMDNRGRLYFGSLPQSTVNFVDTNGNPTNLASSARRVVGNRREMQWPDALAFDGAGNLLFTSNRWQLVANGLINPQEVNYRIIRIKTGSVSYLFG